MMLGFSGTLVAVAGQDGGVPGFILMMLGFSCTLVEHIHIGCYSAPQHQLRRQLRNRVYPAMEPTDFSSLIAGPSNPR
jgi:hypothetical protein